MTTDPVDDSVLVSRFQEGDTSAFSTLFQRHQASVARLIARMIGEPFRHQSQVVELEDLVQDVFVQVYRSLGGFRGHSKVSTWIYRIAVNVVLMHRRSLRARPMFYSADDIDAPISPDPIPDEEATRRANVDALYRLLSQVTEKKRTVYILHEIEGLSAAEIADIVGAPVLTVRTRLFYARREVTALLRDDPHLSLVLKELDTEAARVARRENPFQVVGAQETPALPNVAVTQDAVTSATRLRSLKEDPGESLAAAPKSASSRSREKRS